MTTKTKFRIPTIDRFPMNVAHSLQQPRGQRELLEREWIVTVVSQVFHLFLTAFKNWTYVEDEL